MGGQNHQPTNQVRLIAPSAWLSQKVGDGFAQVLRANSELENAIIAGMNHLHVEDLAVDVTQSSEAYLGEAIALLRQSLETISAIDQGFANLLSAADEEGYRGNPLASRVREFGLQQQFAGTLVVPSVHGGAWEAIESRIEETNILATLRWEAGQFRNLDEPTRHLITVLEGCLETVRTSGAKAFVERVECNEIALRQSYARVFSMWNYLHAMFLYSALQMTELFYRTNSFGTLLSDEPVGESVQRTA